ncbi:MAG: hypothetical protein Q4D16_05340 [Eubacteriales bacterium]|nr:hypothetical protein [Eubacteriales bacterium]
MSKKKTILIRVLAVLVLLLIAAAMMVIGRGHTVYFDNVETEYEGKTYTTPYRIDVYVKEERAAKLKADERGMASWMGANFKMTVEITENKGDEPTTRELAVKLPQNMDGIILNMPALLADLPEEAYLSEFVQTVVEEPEEEPVDTDTPVDELGTDGFEGMGDI